MLFNTRHLCCGFLLIIIATTYRMYQYHRTTNSYVCLKFTALTPNLGSVDTDRGASSPNHGRTPIILLYNEWGGHVPQWHGFFVKRRNDSLMYQPACPHKCYFTMDREKHQGTADLVLVNVFYHIPGKLNASRIIETQENTGQIWAAVMTESAHYMSKNAKPIDNVFHWIASVRRDADFAWPFGWFYRLPVPATINYHIDIKTKPFLTQRKLVAWLVSHCETHSERERVVKTLRKYVPVDVYGSCNKNRCPSKGSEYQSCREFLQNNYKFYLAFENSLCVDYVTEKFFYSYVYDMVPITYGWADYERIAPPHSYINALDFKSVKELADYLVYLDKNNDEYLRYFWWKQSYGLVASKQPDALCRMCSHLRNYTLFQRDSSLSLPRHRSVLKWYKSFPRDIARYESFDMFTVGEHKIHSNSVCISPKEIKELKSWIRN